MLVVKRDDAVNLQVHIYVDTLTKKGHGAVKALRLNGLDIDIHEINFNDVVTANYTVWGSSSVKLSLEANYIRFYAPKLLKEETEMFLYFDSDTLFVNGGLDQLFYTPLLTPTKSLSAIAFMVSPDATSASSTGVTIP